MSATTRRIREMSVVVECDIPTGVTLEEYRGARATSPKRGLRARFAGTRLAGWSRPPLPSSTSEA
jgi:hypothetical protein